MLYSLRSSRSPLLNRAVSCAALAALAACAEFPDNERHVVRSYETALKSGVEIMADDVVVAFERGVELEARVGDQTSEIHWAVLSGHGDAQLEGQGAASATLRRLPSSAARRSSRRGVK